MRYQATRVKYDNQGFIETPRTLTTDLKEGRWSVNDAVMYIPNVEHT